MKYQREQSKVVRSDRRRDALPGDILIMGSGHRMICCPVCLRMSTIAHTLSGPDERPTLSPSVVCGHRDCGGHFFVRDGQILRC